MPTPPRRELPPARRPIPWQDVRRHATMVYRWLEAGWTALDDAERKELRRLVGKSRGRPRNLSRDEARTLGRLAGKAANAARTRTHHR